MTEQQFNDAFAIYSPFAGRKGGKIYNVKGDAAKDLVTTGGGGTRTNKTGGVEIVAANFPKIDYTSGQPAFLIEPTRTNYVTNTQDFDLAYYSKTNVTITPNQILAPDGVSMADRVVLDRTSGEAYLRPAPFQFPANTICTVSFWVRTVTGTAVLGLYNEQPGGDVTKKTENINTTWRRVSFQKTSKATPDEMYAGLANTATLNTTQIIDCYVWGFQIENGVLTSFIPTNGAAVTRTANYYDGPITLPTNYTVYINLLSRHTPASEQQYFVLYNSTNPNNDFLTFRRADSNGRLDAWNRNPSATTSAYIIEPVFDTLTKNVKAVLRINNGVLSYFLNGNLIGSDALDFPFTPNRLMVGNAPALNKASLLTCYNLEILPSITDAEAIALTTL